MIVYSPIYNEMPWTPFLLEHLLEYDCPIYISEGASDIIQFDSERSIDGSLEYILEYVNKYKQFTLVYHNLEDKKYGKNAPRGIPMVRVWDSLEHGEWMMGFAPDNYYKTEDIKKLKDIFNSEVPENTCHLVTGMKTFAFNFNTVVTKRDIKGLTKGWVTMWPCIWRKQNRYSMTPTNELLVDKNGNTIKARTIQKSKQWKDVIVREDITMFHYKAVKKAYTRQKRLGDRETKDYLNHPLQADYLKTYNGSHPKILDNHPWRYEDDCRRLDV